MYNNRQYSATNIAGKVTSQSIFSGAGVLHAITINGIGTGGTITITDASSPSVTVGTITLSGSPFTTLFYDASIAGGLQITTSASPNITVTWDRY